MARPIVLQRLKKGKLLSSNNFPQFVNTWNWMVEAFDSLCGDADINARTGHITVDRSDSDCPIIRFAGETSAYIPTWKLGRFPLSSVALTEEEAEEEDPDPKWKVGSGWYCTGGQWHIAESSSEFRAKTGLIVLRIDITGSEPSEEFMVLDSPTSLLDDSINDPDHYIMPLYELYDGVVTCDWRIGPYAIMGEFS